MKSFFMSAIGQVKGEQRLYGTSAGKKTMDQVKQQNELEMIEENNKSKPEEMTIAQEDIKTIKINEDPLLKDFYDELGLKITNFAKEEFDLIKRIMLSKNDDDFIDYIEKLTIKINEDLLIPMTTSESQIFAEILQQMRYSFELKNTFNDLKELIGDTILDIKRSANLTWKLIEKKLEERPELLAIPVTTIAIIAPIIIVIIALAIAKDDGQRELDKKIKKIV